MDATQRTVLVTAILVAAQCLLAGAVTAAELIDLTGGTVEAVETILAALSALCLGILGTVFLGTRHLIKALKGDEVNPLWKIYAKQLDSDTDLREMLKKMCETLDRHDKAIAPIIKDYMLRKASSETGRPWEKS